jgi:hypothetical protein
LVCQNAGISAGKRLSEAGITDLLILEATDHVGGRMHKQNFAGINVEVGANWVEGVNGGKMNPIWPIVNSTLKLRNFRSDFDYLSQNVYKEKYAVESTEKKLAQAYATPIIIKLLYIYSGAWERKSCCTNQIFRRFFWSGFLDVREREGDTHTYACTHMYVSIDCYPY